MIFSIYIQTLRKQSKVVKGKSSNNMVNNKCAVYNLMVVIKKEYQLNL